ncbi:MAG: hypothetical protein DRJ42_06055 [Deltaproteobacteria bacterium]|nr:MAG: hypothetical protein DRJ42_06055 [Deltaproteobacteria bacterium]
MAHPVTDQELADALAAALDTDGNDSRLAKRMAEMTDEARRQSEENLKASLDQARASLAKTNDG